MISNRLALTAAAAVLLAGCGEKDEPGFGGGGSGGDGRSLSGCLDLWEGPHLGSTRLQVIAKNQPIYAKVEVKGGRCVVALASEDAKVYGRYIEKPNVTGAWTKDAESAPRNVARRVVRSANATGNPDGSLTPGAPDR